MSFLTDQISLNIAGEEQLQFNEELQATGFTPSQTGDQLLSLSLFTASCCVQHHIIEQLTE